MKKIKPVVTRNAMELARALDLSASDSAEWEIRGRLNDKIIQSVKTARLTHEQVAKAAGTSRSRITAILNRDRSHVSTDLLLRVLRVFGYSAKITFTRTRRAA